MWSNNCSAKSPTAFLLAQLLSDQRMLDFAVFEYLNDMVGCKKLLLTCNAVYGFVSLLLLSQGNRLATLVIQQGSYQPLKTTTCFSQV